MARVFKRSLLLSVFSFIVFLLPAQNAPSPFCLRGEVAAPLVIVSFSAQGGAYYFKQRHPRVPTEESILRLQPRQVNRFDRSAIYQHSKVARYISDATLYSAPLLPLILLSNPNSRKDFGKIFLMDVEVFLLNTALTNLVKEAVHRPRPLAYNPRTQVWEKRYSDNFHSFFSGHVSTVASQSFFFAYVWQAYNPDNKWAPLVWSLSATLPVITALTRYKAGKHFWTDVLAGYAVGALVGVAVPALQRQELWRGK